MLRNVITNCLVFQRKDSNLARSSDDSFLKPKNIAKNNLPIFYALYLISLFFHSYKFVFIGIGIEKNILL
jgi:hypothetical protein